MLKARRASHERALGDDRSDSPSHPKGTWKTGPFRTEPPTSVLWTSRSWWHKFQGVACR